MPGGDPSTLQNVESSLGVDFSVIRIFARWNTVFPDADDQAILDSGHAIHLSVRPRSDDGTVVPWSEMAAAQPGSAVYSEKWRRGPIEAILVGDDGYFTLNHEPETRDSSGNGGAEDFKAAWRAFTAIVRERGGANISMAWIMTGGAFSDGRADEWYPGDDVVDVVGTDPYNWHLCQGTTRDWRPFDSLVSPALSRGSAQQASRGTRVRECGGQGNAWSEGRVDA
ncbi:MAG: glycosyl hydrolase [Acidimicrobiales bacterium]